MKTYYRVTITKQPVGSAIKHREPPIQGHVIFKVTDGASAGDYRLVAIEATDAQHKANLALAGIEELTESQAAKLAKQYRPKTTRTRFSFRKGRQEKITRPAADLKKLIGKENDSG
jgi:hypothetical protein